MQNKFSFYILSFILIFTLTACNGNKADRKSPADYWNSLDRDQKHIQVTTELEVIRSSGLTVVVEDYYFIDKLDAYYHENHSEALPVKKAIRKIGLTTGAIH